MIRIRVSRNAWLKFIFACSIFIAIFGELKSNAATPLYQIAARIDGMKLKYLLEVFAIGIGLVGWYRSSEKRKASNINMRYEAGNILAAIGVFAVITFFFQAVNGFSSWSINEFIYFLIPILFVFVYVNVIDGDVSYIFEMVFYLMTFLFLYYMGRKFTPANFRLISFGNSSSPFESIFSYFACVLMMYFLYEGKKAKSFICLFITVISFKRIAMIYALLIFIVYKFVPKNKPVSPVLINIVKVFFVVVPFVIATLCNDDFAAWFNESFNMDIYKLTMGRFERINMVLDSGEMKYGLGSTTSYFLNNYRELGYTLANNVYNIHNDIARFYIETTAVGSIAYTWFNFNSVKFCYASFLLMLYVFTDMMFSHLTGSGTVTLWILIYFMIYYFNTKSREVREQAEEAQ